MRRRVGLLFGGRSVEHEVSVSSARGVAPAIVASGMDCVPLAVCGDGRWLSPDLSARVLAGAGPRAEPDSGEDDGSRIVLDPGVGLACVDAAGVCRPVELDVLFPLVHGWGGEDGRLQGALDLCGVAYVGAGVLGSATGMDKIAARALLNERGLPGVAWFGLERSDFEPDRAAACERVARELGFPVFVKPANGGSSVGVSRVASATGLQAAFDEAYACDGRVVVERGVDAREIEAAVLGNERPEVARALGEIVPSREFYDYAAKYEDGTSELIVPASLAPPQQEAIRRHAVEAFRALDLRGLARVDFLVDRGNGEVFLNEVNTLPGFTPISMFPKLWEASGLPFPKLIGRLIELALEHRAEQTSRRTVRKEA